MILGCNGFWATGIPKDKEGMQPADIIACNHLGTHLIDAKLCKRNKFDLSRVEDNQISSMRHIDRKAGGYGWFACGFTDRIVMLSYKYVMHCINTGKKSLSNKDLPSQFGLEYWINANRDF